MGGIHRAFFVKPKEKNTYTPINVTKLCFSVLEIRLQEDFMVDEVLIIDMSTFSFLDLCKLSPRLLITTLKIYRVNMFFHLGTYAIFLVAEYFFDEIKPAVFD